MIADKASCVKWTFTGTLFERMGGHSNGHSNRQRSNGRGRSNGKQEFECEAEGADQSKRICPSTSARLESETGSRLRNAPDRTCQIRRSAGSHQDASHSCNRVRALAERTREVSARGRSR